MISVDTSSSIVDYGNSGTEPDVIELRLATVPIPRGEVKNNAPNDNENTAAQVAELEHNNMNTVEAGNVEVTDWYHVACETVVVFNSTTHTGPGISTFFKYL